MSMTDIKASAATPVVSKSAPKASNTRKQSAKPKAEQVEQSFPQVGHAVLNGGGGQTWLVVGSPDVVRKGRTVTAVSGAGKSRNVVVNDVFKFDGKAYGTYAKA